MNKIDLVGKTFGKLTVLYASGPNNRREIVWVCLCECGNIKTVAGSLLRIGSVKSCGCYRNMVPSTSIIPHKFINDMEHKRCSSCHNWKPLSEFTFNKSNRDGFSYNCKNCVKAHAEKTRERRLFYKKEYRAVHKDEITKKALDYVNFRRKNDIGFRIHMSLSARIRLALHGKNKSKGTIELLGCSIEQLKERLQSRFDENMSWENYGSYWHVDHIKPCASFDLSKPEQQKICFHYTNLQPLEAIENIRKGAKI